MEKARAWVIEAKDKLAMRELDILEPGDYEVLLKTEEVLYGPAGPQNIQRNKELRISVSWRS